ncbi:hypothetical protein H2199_003337 [Coniosporium tulheliwenetii]|nr:hypothetical protein H2199_003337 [Cladosporium sp. JES 115]
MSGYTLEQALQGIAEYVDVDAARAKVVYVSYCPTRERKGKEVSTLAIIEEHAKFLQQAEASLVATREDGEDDMQVDR